MGGIWESVVKSAKGLLKRQFTNATLTILMLQTAMCEIEAILNSRPLAPLTDDDDELMAITPAMLLTGFKHRLFPVLAGRKPAQLAVSKDPVQRYRYLQSLITKFWYDWKHSVPGAAPYTPKIFEKCAKCHCGRNSTTSRGQLTAHQVAPGAGS